MRLPTRLTEMICNMKISKVSAVVNSCRTIHGQQTFEKSKVATCYIYAATQRLGQLFCICGYICVLGLFQSLCVCWECVLGACVGERV